MDIRIASCSLAATVLLASAPALAATAKATVITYVGTSNSSSLNPSNAQCNSAFVVHECEQFIDAPLLATDPDGVRAQTVFRRDGIVPPQGGSQAPGAAEGKATAYALPGSLHAEVEVQVYGAGYFPGQGAAGYGFAQIEDRLKITSSTLANGTAVTMATTMAINGEGRGSAYLRITTLRSTTINQTTTLVYEEDVASASADLESLSGQFIAYVGETLNLDFGLRASAGVNNFSWGPIDVINGRASSSKYGNSAYLYFASEDPNVQWVADSGASYMAAVVPSQAPTR